ncbi:MAG: F0F1 ATP synthase subunit epsilon [Bacteroidales bacterium]|nr:F0F1 ATP synthase subunit epsilon [Bacteroidales bacterium]
MFLTVLTPERALLEINVSKVELPGAKGRFMVLKNHIPLISSLVEGKVVYVADGKEGSVTVRAGFVEINENRVIVCAEV